MAPRKPVKKAKGKTPIIKDGLALKDKKGKQSLYALLRVPERTSDVKVIQRAYKVLARELHPDKHPEDSKAATAAFQQLGHAYEILSDSAKRDRYDRTGLQNDDIAGDGFDAAHASVNAFSRRVNKEEFTKMLQEFEAQYKGSKDESADVLAHVKSHRGDVSHLLESVMLSRLEDADRFVAMLKKSFSRGQLPKSFEKRFLATIPTMLLTAKKERKLFEKESKRAGAKKGSSSTDLALSLQAASQRRTQGGFLGAILQTDLEDPLAGRDLREVRKQQGKSRQAASHVRAKLRK